MFALVSISDRFEGVYFLSCIWKTFEQVFYTIVIGHNHFLKLPQFSYLYWLGSTILIKSLSLSETVLSNFTRCILFYKIYSAIFILQLKTFFSLYFIVTIFLIAFVILFIHSRKRFFICYPS